MKINKEYKFSKISLATGALFSKNYPKLQLHT